MKKPRAKEQRTLVGGVEGLPVAMLDRVISLCPPNMRVAVVIHHPEKGPLLIGNCCRWLHWSPDPHGCRAGRRP